MSKWIEFHSYSTYFEGSAPPRYDGERRLIPACGDRSVIHLDARMGADVHREIGLVEGKRRGFAAFRVISGDHLQAAKPITDLIMI